MVAQLVGVDGVAAVMSGAVGDEDDLVFVSSLGFGSEFVEDAADGLDDLEVGSFVSSADVVGFAGDSLLVDEPEGLGMVFDEEPVADVVALAVDGELLAVEGVEDDERDELLGEVVGAVVVGAVAEEDGESEGVSPGADEVVAGGLAGGVWGLGVVGGCLGEESVGAEGAVDLVGGDVLEAEGLAAVVGEVAPVVEGALEEVGGAEDVGADKAEGVVDRAVDMAFGGEVHDGVRLEVVEELSDALGVADVELCEAVEGGVLDFLEAFEVSGVGEFVEVADIGQAVADQMSDERRADKACAASHDDVSHGWCVSLW